MSDESDVEMNAQEEEELADNEDRTEEELNLDDLYTRYRVRRTCLEMARDRGFNVDEENIDQTFEQFQAKYKEQAPSEDDLSFVVIRDDGVSLKLYYSLEEKMGVKAIREQLKDMEDNDVNDAILVSKGPLTSSAVKLVMACINVNVHPVTERRYVQIFEQSELVVNVTEHILVPKHELLSEDDKQELLKRYKLKAQQLPRMKVTDPVAKYYGLFRGQVVKITRKESPTAGRYVSYRLVS